MSAFAPITRNAFKTVPVMPALLRTQSTSSSARYTYRIAASSAGKKTPPRQPKLGQDYWHFTSTSVDPSPPYLRSTKKDSGEDAFFATTIGSSPHHVALGLADGVGGWQDSGVDPSDFSHGLCGLMAGTAKEWETEKENDLKPTALLQTAYDAVMANPRIRAGGSTASLAVINEGGQMEAANLGDSGFLILSPGKVSARSEAQTHAFNTPYQLSKLPPQLRAQEAIFGGGAKHFSETPSQSDVTRHALKHGDVVMFATDGVWDNLSAQDTLDIVAKVMLEQGYWFKSHNFPDAETMLNTSMIESLPRELGGKADEGYLPGLLASSVMRAAKLAGLDRKRDGPFAREVKMHYPQEGWQGGKPDDIAVVVAVAVEGEENDRAKL